MTGLVLKLGPRERLLINGAVIENGDRRSRMNILTPGAKILRLRDAIHPDDATTPVRRICYTLQMVLSGDLDVSTAMPDLLSGIEQLSPIFADPDSHRLLSVAIGALREDRFYQALKALRELLPMEERLLNLRRGH